MTKKLSALPAPGTRWVAARKGAVVAAVNSGALSPQEACTRYSLSMDELELWQRAVDQVGVKALRATQVQHYPQLYKRADDPVACDRPETLDGVPRRRVSI
jgi:transposase